MSDLLLRDITPALLTRNLYCGIAVKNNTETSDEHISNFRRDMISAKGVSESGYAIFNQKWISGEIYDRYDIYHENNLTVRGYSSNQYARIYVVNSKGQIFVCLDNKDGETQSIYEPKGSHNDLIYTPDGYIWKFLMDTSGFSSNEDYIFLRDFSGGEFQFGQISSIKVINPGMNVTSSSFSLIGDGEGAEIEPIFENGKLSYVRVLNIGFNYTYLNVVFSGTASILPTVRVIFQPHGGFGYQPKIILSPRYLYFKTIFTPQEYGYDIECDRTALISTQRDVSIYSDYTSNFSIERISGDQLEVSVGSKLYSEKNVANYLYVLEWDPYTLSGKCIRYGEFSEGELLSGFWKLKSIYGNSIDELLDTNFLYIEKKEVFKSFEYQRTHICHILPISNSPASLFDISTFPTDWQFDHKITENVSGKRSYQSLRHGSIPLLERLEQTSNDWINLTIPWELKPIDFSCTDPFLGNIEIVPIKDDYGNNIACDESVFRYVKHLKSLGYKVAITPILFGNFSDIVFGRNRIIPIEEELRDFFYKETGYKQFISHYISLFKHLNVDAFFIGHQLQRLTLARYDGKFPFVDMLKELSSLSKMYSPDTKVSYSASLYEYSGVQYSDGVFYPLDELWGDQNIDFVSVEYAPRMRDETILQSYDSFKNWYYGEEYYWYKNNDGQIRFKIDESAVNNSKNIFSFWNSWHDENGNFTKWSPRLKPIWITDVYTELGYNPDKKTRLRGSTEKFLKFFGRLLNEEINALFGNTFMIEKIFVHDSHIHDRSVSIWNFFEKQLYEETQSKVCDQYSDNPPLHNGRFTQDCIVHGNCCPKYNRMNQYNNQIPYGATCPYSYDIIKKLLCIGCYRDEDNILRCSPKMKIQQCCNANDKSLICSASRYFNITSSNGVIEYGSICLDEESAELPDRFKERYSKITPKYYYFYDGTFKPDNTINFGEL